MSFDYEAWCYAAFAAFNRRDWDAVARGLPEDFEFHDHVSVDDVTKRGPGAIREITEANGDAAFTHFQMVATEIEVFEEAAGVSHVLVRVSTSATGGSSAIPVTAEIGHLWTFENETIKRAHQFRSWDEARRAALMRS